MTDYSRLERTVFAPGSVSRLDVMVIGAGALGNEVVKALGLLGVGRIVIVDPDVVEASNLTRSVLLRTPTATGRNKALALADASSRLFADSEIAGIGREIADVGFETIRAADLLFGCVDSDLARLEIAYLATKLDLAVCDAGLGGSNYSHGRVTWFPGRQGACHGCRLRGQTRRELLASWESSPQPCWGNDEPGGADALPSTPTMAAVTGSMQVEIGLRHWLGRGKDRSQQAVSVEISLDDPPRLETMRIPLNANCPFHRPEDGLLTRPPEKEGFTFADLLQQAPQQGPAAGRPVILLDWPVCTAATCDDCGLRWSPLRRLAAVRRRGRCPRCGSRYFSGWESVSQVDQQSPWLQSRPGELGLPPDHLYTIHWEGAAPS